jgi:cob(I)alamin adenosyltransferase
MVKLNKIYTRTGDAGTTGLVDGSRRAKHDARMVAIGEVDEANSALGLAVLAVAAIPAPAVTAELARIQNDLFDLGADLATPASGPDDDFAPGAMTLRIVPGQVDWLEQAIDAHNADLPRSPASFCPVAARRRRGFIWRVPSCAGPSGPVWHWRRPSRSIRRRWPISTGFPITASCWRARSTRAPIRSGFRVPAALDWSGLTSRA